MTLQWVSKIMSIGVAGFTIVLSLSPTLAVSKPTVVGTPAPIVISSSHQPNGAEASCSKISVEISNHWTDYLNIFPIIATVVGACFALRIYRKTKQWIQLDIDANLYKLSRPELDVTTYTRDQEGNLGTIKQDCTHAVEVLLKFKNKGMIRFKLYNLQIFINTMQNHNEVAKCEEADGHLRLKRIFTSGNIVPEIKPKWNEKLKFKFWNFSLLILSSRSPSTHWVAIYWLLAKPQIKWYEKHKWHEEHKYNFRNFRLLILSSRFNSAQWVVFFWALRKSLINKHSCYYIEPNVEQTIHYLALIPQPRELLQVVAKFSLEPKRIFPHKERTENKGLFRKPYPLPHTAARTYQIDSKTGTFKI